MSHLAVVLLLFAAIPGQFPQSDGDSNPDSDARISLAIRRLGDSRFAIREEATQELWRMGLAAEGALQEAATSSDIEVAARAKSVLRKFRSGIFIETPPETLRLIQEYLAGNAGQKNDILRNNRERIPSLTRLLLIKNEPDLETRKNLANYFDNEIRSGVAELYIHGEYQQSENILASLAELEIESGYCRRDYAAILLRRGKLDSAVKKLTLSASPERRSGFPRLLATLLQVQGNLPDARKAADLAKDRYLQKDIYHRQEDWQALLELDFIPKEQSIETLGFKAAYLRLAGDRDRFQRIIATLQKDRPGGWMSVEALLINGCWNEALDILDETSQIQAFDLRCQQGKFGDAFEKLKIQDPGHEAAAWLAEKLKMDSLTSSELESLFAISLRLSKTLWELGEREEADKLFSILDALAQKGGGQMWAQIFVFKETMGLRELALQAASKALQDSPGKGHVFYHMYGDEGQYLAHEWWKILREQSPHEETSVTFGKLQSLLSAKEMLYPGLNLVDLVARAENGLPKLKVEQRVYRLQAMGDVCSIRGFTDLAIACFEKQAVAAGDLKEPEFPEFEGYYPPRKVAPWWHMGDAFARSGEWRKAATAYNRAWQLNRRNAVPLYLQGFALKKAGDAKGQKLIDLALTMPLADSVKRRELAEIMEQQGEKEAALAQQELILRLGVDEFWEGDNDWAIRYAERAVASQVESAEPLRAASLRQLAIMYALKTNSGYTEAGEYLVAVHQIHRTRAIGLLRAGRVDEAMKELTAAQRARPDDVDLVLQAFPLLIASRKDAAADALFAVAFETLDGACRDFPRFAGRHHDLARLCFRTGRQPGDAEQHALAAVKLDSSNFTYVLTLADVYDLKGERIKAVTVLQEAIRRNPHQSELRQRLDRLNSR